MTNQVPFQTLTRAARRRTLEAERSQAAGANAPAANALTTNTLTANEPTVNEPTVNEPTANELTANEPTVNIPTVNASTVNVPTVTVTPPILGPGTSTPEAPNPAPLVAEDVDDYQDQDQNEEEDTPLLEQGNEAGEMMEWMETSAANERDVPSLLPGPTERILIDRCTSPLCPVPSTIPHDRGVYLHNDEVNQRPESYIFGLSNPPPEVWLMIGRVNSGTAQPGDFDAVMAFVRNHAFLSGPEWPCRFT
ncbi:hypothetical protein MMC22_006696 [Lobaria immixta]|nr:hypothetical protein [Lobaria immixta]